MAKAIRKVQATAKVSRALEKVLEGRTVATLQDLRGILKSEGAVCPRCGGPLKRSATTLGRLCPVEVSADLSCLSESCDHRWTFRSVGGRSSVTGDSPRSLEVGLFGRRRRVKDVRP